MAQTYLLTPFFLNAVELFFQLQFKPGTPHNLFDGLYMAVGER